MTAARFRSIDQRTLRRRAFTALDRAIAGDLDAAGAAMVGLNIDHGPEAFAAALLVWVDTLIEATPGLRHGDPVRLDGAAAKVDEPITRWSRDVIAARLAGDRAALEAVLAAPRGPAAVKEHVLGLLSLIVIQLQAEEAGA